LSNLNNFDPSSAGRPALNHELERLASRLKGLSKRREDLEYFLDHVSEQPFLTVAVAMTTDRAERFFTIPLDTQAVTTVRMLCATADSALIDEIDIVKGHLRQVLDAF